ncbi:MAG: 50S ribosomal protein L10 [Planctomycetes bacterium]|nr:50S ribosomal protein L10 [Planctomycetota bacterium]
MSKLVKQLEIDTLTKTFKGVRDMVLLSSVRVGSLLEYTSRKTLRDKKVRLQMVKNTLARKVFEGQGVKLDDKVWSGTTVVAWGADSIKDLSKAVDALLKDIAKKNPKDDKKFVVKTAVADGQAISLDMAMKMPTRLEAIGDILGMIMGPVSDIAGSLTGAASEVASQIKTLADRKEDAAPAPAA